MLYLNDDQQFNSSNNNNNEKQTKLLNLTYFKLQSVKYNKLSRKPIETPLQQSVMVWNFLKKLEHIRLTTTTTSDLVLIESTTTATSEWSCTEKIDEDEHKLEDNPLDKNEQEEIVLVKNFVEQAKQLVDDNSNKENQQMMMDIDIPQETSSSSSTSSTLTTAIGSERRTKLLNKIDHHQQTGNVQKRVKSSATVNFYSLYDYIEDENNDCCEDDEDDDSGDENEDENNMRRLSSSISKNILCTNNNHQNTNNNSQFNLWSNSFNYLNKSCSYEDQHHQNHQLLSSAFSLSPSNSSSNNNIEQIINILIECE